MNKKVIIGIILTSIMLIFTTNAYCVLDPSTTRIKIDGSDAWTNITIGESYVECEMLNSPDSTLGTAQLEAHLTTDYDWNGMAIFSVSQYGGSISNAPSTTTANRSGIYNVGAKSIQTATILKGFTGSTGNFAGLYKDGVLKKYVKIIDSSTGKEYDSVGNETGRTAISLLTSNGTFGWHNSERGKGTSTSYPIGIKVGLFGIHFGLISYYGASGGRYDNVTFWPVIWN